MDRDGRHPWDGVAQLWWPRPLPKPRTGSAASRGTPFSRRPSRTCLGHACEHVVLDGGEHLSTAPLTLNAPYPMKPSAEASEQDAARRRPDELFR